MLPPLVQVLSQVTNRDAFPDHTIKNKRFNCYRQQICHAKVEY